MPRFAAPGAAEETRQGPRDHHAPRAKVTIPDLKVAVTRAPLDDDAFRFGALSNDGNGPDTSWFGFPAEIASDPAPVDPAEGYRSAGVNAVLCDGSVRSAAHGLDLVC